MTLLSISPEALNLYRSIKGEIEPTKGDEFLRYYFAFHGDLRYEKVATEEISRIEMNCLVRGIYFNLEFAYWCKDHLCGKSIVLDSAISAKLIMNNDLSYLHPKIYCIWFPQLPSEATCRKLLSLNQNYKYLIGRVCAIANYPGLYRELDLLPEISILNSFKDQNNVEMTQQIENQIHKDGIWHCMDDTYGHLFDLVQLSLDDSKEIETLTQFYMKALYDPDDEEYVSVISEDNLYTFYGAIDPNETGILTLAIDDIHTDFYDVDPLGTNIVSMQLVDLKFKVIELRISS